MLLSSLTATTRALVSLAMLAVAVVPRARSEEAQGRGGCSGSCVRLSQCPELPEAARRVLSGFPGDSRACPEPGPEPWRADRRHPELVYPEPLYPEPLVCCPRHRQDQDRSRRSIGGEPCKGQKAQGKTAASDALPLTLRPFVDVAPTAPAPASAPAPAPAPASLALPLLPLNGPGGVSVVVAPGQISQRSSSSSVSRQGGQVQGQGQGQSQGGAAAPEADVWFPDIPRPASSSSASFNRPPEDATKRPPVHPAKHEQATRRSYERANDHATRRSYEYTSGEHTTRRPSYEHTTRRAYGHTTKRLYDYNGHREGAVTWQQDVTVTTRRPYNSNNNSDVLPPNRQGQFSSRKHNVQGTEYNANRAGWGAPDTARTANPNWGAAKARPTGRTTSISERKCAEFARLQTERVVALPLVPDPKPSVQHVQKCDINSVPLVVGGQDARLHEFPHMAAIGYRGAGTPSRIEWNCGGSLISELFVLTAAHCTATAQGPPIRVRLGEHNLESNEDGARPMDVAVSSMVRHPGYQPPARYHDIGLLRLARKVPFGTAIRPACLHTASEDGEEDSFASEPLIATGWGHTEQLGEMSQVLQKVILNFVDQRTCNNLYSADASTSSLSRGIVADSQLCAGVLDGGRDTCQGDSGGPLQVTSSNNQCVFHIVGITSFGKVCAARNSPGVYTRVSKYIPWIERHVWPEA